MLSDRELKILLTKAAKDPYYVFTNKDCLQLEFVHEFLELCSEVMFNQPQDALEQSFIARQLARNTRDAHVQAKSIGMVGSGYRIESLYTRAKECFREAEVAASGCSCCLADIYRRKGLAQLYQKEFEQGCYTLSKSLHFYEEMQDAEGIGRVLIHRGTGLCALDRVEEAMQDERRGLELLSLETPSRYYIAVIINIAAILAWPTNTEQLQWKYDDALRDLRRVRKLLKGEKRRHEYVRVILRWIEGLLWAKKKNRRQAFRFLISAQNGLERLGMRSEYIAISADIAKLYKTGTPRSNDDQVIGLAADCLERMNPTEEEKRFLKELCLYPEIGAIESLRKVAASRIPELI